MIGAREVNPFAPDPDVCSSGELVTGGAGDGQAHHIVAMMLQRLNARHDTVSLEVFRTDRREFDLAELVAWAADTAGVERALPLTTSTLRGRCYARRLMVDVATAPARRGLLLFGGGQLAVTVGLRNLLIVHTPASGVVAVDAGVWAWDEAAQIPDARGYR